MPIKLTWDDLLIQNIPESDARKWLGYWSKLVNGTAAVVFMSKFGDWFLRRPDGSTDELSVIEGTYQRIANNPEEFSRLVNTQQWQETHLLSLLVMQLHERGSIAGPNQCYAFASHPIWTGKIDVSQAVLMDIGVWQHICAEAICGQAKKIELCSSFHEKAESFSHHSSHRYAEA